MDELSELGSQYWCPNDVLSFLNALLNWVKGRLSAIPINSLEEENGVTFTISYKGAGAVIELVRAEHPELRKAIRITFR